MAIAQLLIWAATLVMLVAVSRIPRVGYVLSNFLLFAIFLFAAAVVDIEQGLFYGVMLSAVLLAPLYKSLFPINNEGPQFSGQLGGLKSMAVILVAGIVLVVGIRALGTAGSVSVLGVPKLLAISGTVDTLIAPTLISALGYIENRFFFNLFDILKYIFVYSGLGVFAGPFLIILPFVLTALIFAFYHFAVLNAGGLIFAFLAFLAFQGVSLSPLGEEVANVAHYLNNGIESASKLLSVTGGFA